MRITVRFIVRANVGEVDLFSCCGAQGLEQEAASGPREWFQCSEMFPGESGSRSRVSPRQLCANYAPVCVQTSDP